MVFRWEGSVDGGEGMVGERNRLTSCILDKK